MRSVPNGIRFWFGVFVLAALCLFFWMASSLSTQDLSVAIRRILPANGNFGKDGRRKLSKAELDVLYAKAISKNCPFPQLSRFTNSLTDFETFPCLRNLKPSEDLKRYGHCVRTADFPLSMLINKTACPVLKMGRGTPICTYPSAKDIYVSASVNAGRVWEKHLLEIMLGIFKNHPDMAFFDAGANIGIYTLTAALHSRRVVSVDANIDNIYLVSSSLTHGNLWENVSLIWNAFADKHTKVILRKQAYHNNVGGAEIDTRNSSDRGCDSVVNSIILDDLKELLANRKVYMKVDIQGQEHNLLAYGKDFFNVVDVRFVQIEYVFFNGKPEGKIIRDFLTAYNFSPFTDCTGRSRLNIADDKKWPFDMCFIKNDPKP